MEVFIEFFYHQAHWLKIFSTAIFPLGLYILLNFAFRIARIPRMRQAYRMIKSNIKRGLYKINSNNSFTEEMDENIDDQENVQTSATESSTGTYDICPICLESTTLRLETNCGHIYCGFCFSSYLKTTRRSFAAQCPVCRREISLLILKFTEIERDLHFDGKDALLEEVRLYNLRFSGQPVSWKVWFLDFPTIVRHALIDLLSGASLTTFYYFRIIVCIIMAFFYILSPLNIISEDVYGFLGVMDDILIVVFLASYSMALYRTTMRDVF